MRLRCISPLLLMLFIAPLNAAEVTDITSLLSQKEREKVESGKLIVRSESVGDTYIKEVHAFLMIQAPASDILSLITDYEQLPDFMPNLARVEVLKEDNQGALVNYYLDLPFGVHKRYRLQVNYDTTPPDLRMAWQSVAWQGVKAEETIVDTAGYWLLIAKNDDETWLHYYTKTDPGHVPFSLGWIVDYLTKTTVIELLERTKDRAEEQWKAQLQEQ